jgi:ubiquinone/menaquinone biosynthesis C-methylase UbiE
MAQCAGWPSISITAPLAAARANLRPFPTIEVTKSSAYELPWRDELDIAFSIGVIHHLEFPKRALEAMVRATKPG